MVAHTSGACAGIAQPFSVCFLILQKDSIDILLFGGEYYDGKNDKMRVYNGIYVYHPDKGNWTQIVSANG